jgi:hypothetical protein
MSVRVTEGWQTACLSHVARIVRSGYYEQLVQLPDLPGVKTHWAGKQQQAIGKSWAWKREVKMTLKAKLVAAATTIALVAAVTVAVQRSSYVLSTAETESAFFTNFTPADAVKRLSCQSGNGLSGSSAGAAIGHATHEKDFDQYFGIEPSDWVLVMKSLQDDISSRLLLSHAQILDETGDPVEGFRVRYRSGKSQGVISVEPLQIVDAGTHVLAAGGACKGGVAVRLRLSVKENWYK